MFDADKWLALAAYYPDVVSLAVGTIVGFVFTMMIDLYFLPVYRDAEHQRRQQGFTFLLCWTASTIASVGMWIFMDPKDPLDMKVIVSVIVSVPSFFGYPFLAKLAAGLIKKFLGIDLTSAWSKQGD